MGKDLKGKELGQGISQRKDGSYCGRFINRFGVRKSIYGTSPKEVRNKLAKALNEDMTMRNVVDESITLDKWYEKWMNIYKKPTVRKSTILFYSRVYTDLISPILGREKLTEITKLKVTALLNDLKEKNYQWETLNKVKILLVDMLDRALEDDFIVKNPVKGARIPINKPRTYIKSMSREDQKTFLECSVGTFYYNLFVTALNTGLRPGELFALEEQDIDFKNKTVNVSKNLTYLEEDRGKKKIFTIGPTKTQSSIRTVPLNSYALIALKKQIIQHGVVLNKMNRDQLEFPNLLFTTKFGHPLNSSLYHSAINKIIDEINLTRDSLDKMESYSGHSFRHTFATRCFEAGISPKTVQTYLGHASIKMTLDLYTSVFEDKKQNDIKLLEESTSILNYSNSEDSKIINF